jgi:hypothetical protein
VISVQKKSTKESKRNKSKEYNIYQEKKANQGLIKYSSSDYYVWSVENSSGMLKVDKGTKVIQYY